MAVQRLTILFPTAELYVVRETACHAATEEVCLISVFLIAIVAMKLFHLLINVLINNIVLTHVVYIVKSHVNLLSFILTKSLKVRCLRPACALYTFMH